MVLDKIDFDSYEDYFNNAVNHIRKQLRAQGKDSRYDVVREVLDFPKIRIIRMRKVPFMDSTGANNLMNLIKMSHKDNTQIVLSGVNDSVLEVLEASGISETIGLENICINIDDAMHRAKELLELSHNSDNQ